MKIATLPGLGHIIKGDPGGATVTITEEGLPILKIILQRALNTMSDIPQPLLDLADFLDSHLPNSKTE